MQDFLDAVKNKFELPAQDIRAYSPLSLAYIGDGIYELIVRTVIVGQANRPTHELHKLTTQYVRAQAQAKILLSLREELTEEEADVARRGRNAKPYTTAKNASRADYHKATGFEALMGYLYLTGQTERLLELVHKGMAYLEQEMAPE
ncbi:MAG: ribonuclease III [Lachnospiraceae bacterium]|nr:ribonuclease III [Lachnospiraceae bacterium]